MGDVIEIGEKADDARAPESEILRIIVRTAKDPDEGEYIVCFTNVGLTSDELIQIDEETRKIAGVKNVKKGIPTSSLAIFYRRTSTSWEGIELPAITVMANHLFDRHPEHDTVLVNGAEKTPMVIERGSS